MEVRVIQLFRICGLSFFLLSLPYFSDAQDCEIKVQLNKKDPSCNGSLDGSIELVLEGAAEPVKIHWNTGAQTRNLQNIPAGDYTVFVLDKTGCSLKKQISLFNAHDFIPKITVLNQNQNTKTADLSINNPDSKITKAYFTDYSNLNAIRKIEYQGETIQNIPAGNYLVDVVDHRGCVSSQNVVLNDNE